MIAEELQPAGGMGVGELGQEEPPEQLESTRTGRRKPGRQDTQRSPSSEMPPPGTIMWTCGWWVIAEPQVWSTAVMPMRAPRCLGSAAIVSMRLGRGAEQEVVDHRLVLVGDVGDLGRQREDDVEVADRQQIGLARGEPLPCRRALALGAMPVATAVVGDAAVAAVLARLDMAAEGGGAAGLDRRHHLQLAEARDDRHGPRARRRHGDGRCRRPPATGGAPPPRQASGLVSSSVSSLIRSSGLVTARIVLVATRA